MVFYLLDFGLLIFIFLAFVTTHQNAKLNWAIFYGLLYTIVTLPLVNYCTVKFGFWAYTLQGNCQIIMPMQLYFEWVIIWSIIPFYIFKGRYISIIALTLFWIDILLMPIMENTGIMILNENWYIGDLMLIIFVFIPAYLWTKYSYENTHLQARAFFQVLVMALLWIIILPIILSCYNMLSLNNFRFNPYVFQIFLILIFPALIAVYDLAKKGLGTPFPFDQTKILVTSGPYAYCRNPIQVSFTIMFLPMSYVFGSYWLLLASFFALAFVYGVAEFQENGDMKNRFGEQWEIYKMQVPIWYYLWKPTHISIGKIYLDGDCTQCLQIKKWLEKSGAINLEIILATSFMDSKLTQVTYIDYLGNSYKSVEAIGSAIEHINLAYASLGWFMRFPMFRPILQTIVNTMNFSKS